MNPSENMESPQTTSPELGLAFELIRYTNKSLFLTGKAGSGKTTFLRQIQREGWKRLAVVAPTGVAAINAGGMTIHSLFQIPLGLYIPGAERANQAPQRRFSGSKIRLLKSLEMLIIDEISMVRADLLDAVDEVLRRFRGHTLPFGGIQLLMIGDLHQLPPVTKQEEWQVLSGYYETPYFFSSQALKRTDYRTIELKHIYRQSDQEFIALLNQVRDKRLDAESLRKLNSRYIPGFRPSAAEPYITLTTTNAAANEINASNLARLPGKAQSYRAIVSGDFPSHAYPNELELQFKPGAQVMFIRNDSSPSRRYFNGKIGQITRITPESIYVTCPDISDEIEVVPAEWQNIKYTLNDDTHQIEEQVLGTFTQMPLKLAWAITIHKSQGLTFERAIIDAQASFASGQVYVALSRCKTFEGIILRSPIHDASVKTDSTVLAFTEQADRNAPDADFLRQARREFEQRLLRDLFDIAPIRREFEKLRGLFHQHARSITPEAVQQLEALSDRANQELDVVVSKFAPQLDSYLNHESIPSDNDELRLRLIKAAGYFTATISDLLKELNHVPLTTDNQMVNTSLAALMKSLQFGLFTKLKCFGACSDGLSSTALQRAKMDAELEFLKHGERTSTSAMRVPKGIAHPELYRRLMEWREQQADESNVGTQAIFPNATLRELVHSLPTQLETLRCVGGIGKKRLQRYGKQLCAIIRQYCDETGTNTKPATATQSSSKPSRKPKPGSTQHQSFELFQAGKSIDEIAAERKLTRSTIEGHLASFIATGQIDIFRLMDRESVEDIVRYAQSEPEKTISEMKQHFGDKYSYGELKMAVSHLEFVRPLPSL